jgi:hypothetical protein
MLQTALRNSLQEPNSLKCLDWHTSKTLLTLYMGLRIVIMSPSKLGEFRGFAILAG